MKNTKRTRNLNIINSFGLAVLLFLMFLPLGVPSALFMGGGYAIYTILAIIYPGIIQVGILGTTPLLNVGAIIAVCDCGANANNTGVGCEFIKQVEKKEWLTALVNSAGTLNYIDLTMPITATILSGMVNNVDPLARAYPTPEIKNIDDMRDKVVTEEAKDGSSYFVRLGIRKYTGQVFGGGPQLDTSLQAFRCYKNLGKYVITADGAIWGVISADGTKLYPMPIDAQSISSTAIYTTDTTYQKLEFSYNYHPTFDDRLIRGIAINEFTNGADPRTYTGLLDVFMNVVSCVHTGTMVIDLYDNYGTQINPESVTDFSKSMFSLYDNTTAAAITIDTVVESVVNPGQYTITWLTGVSANDNLTLTITNPGYDCSAVTAQSIIAT